MRWLPYSIRQLHDLTEFSEVEVEVGGGGGGGSGTGFAKASYRNFSNTNILQCYLLTYVRCKIPEVLNIIDIGFY
ncbi:hypothetical protein M0804_000204 [Polistes exclamans]|nr:hypothetical protein M0804_000204 [Polistes exclamans]